MRICVHVCVWVPLGSFGWLGLDALVLVCDFVVELALIVFNIFGGRSLLPGYKTK